MGTQGPTSQQNHFLVYVPEPVVPTAAQTGRHKVLVAALSLTAEDWGRWERMPIHGVTDKETRALIRPAA